MPNNTTIPLSDLDLAGFIAIVLKGASGVPATADLERAARAFAYLEERSSGRVVYGINTGFGPMAQKAIAADDRLAMQYNLIRSHAAGGGADLPDEVVRGMMVVRAVTFLKGGSGVSRGIIDQLLAYLEHGICPRVPEHGGVGASGDLVQQAHLGFGLIGEGYATLKGERMLMADALRRTALAPVQLGLRDGLAIVNGTACMTAVGLLNVHRAQLLFDRAVSISALITEVIGSWNDHLSEPLNAAKRHAGQRKVAQRMRNTLDGSKLIRQRADHAEHDVDANGTFTDTVQEIYSIRCVPQILGPILDVIEHAETTLLNELHSIDDNPFTDPETGIHHGGNFHGDQVALEMDILRLAVVKLGMLCERQLNFLFNDRINGRFPPFLNMERQGVTLGMQGMQFTATSSTAANQALATSLYVHSIPNNNDNQDIVSMGTNAAMATARALDNTARTMSITAIAVAQAVDLAGNRDQLSPAGAAFHSAVRKITGPIVSTSDPAASLEAVESSLLRPLSSWQR